MGPVTRFPARVLCRVEESAREHRIKTSIMSRASFCGRILVLAFSFLYWLFCLCWESIIGFVNSVPVFLVI
jgi:hypothetical protein